MSFQCTVVTPESEAFDSQVTQAILPAHDGLTGVLTDRAPLLVKLGIGPLRLDSGTGQKHFFFIDGGVAQMKDNKLTVLTTQAIPSSELDYETAKAEYAEASARRPTDAKSAAQREKEMARARAKQGIAGKK